MKTLYVILATILLAIPVAVLMIFNLPGLIVLVAILLVAFPFYLHTKKSRATGINPVVPDIHTLLVPELGLTMADGGEEVASSEKIVDKEKS